MDIGALLTSAGINIAICVVLLSLYSILRKQPSNVSVYFMRRLISEPIKHSDPFHFERLVPSASWIVRAWQATNEEILAAGGVDALVFLRIVVFSIRIFIIAAAICVFLLLPVNYYGQEMQHKQIHSESLEVFTIGNVKEGSQWFWTHCLALYVISCSACVLLHFEYKNITKMRLAHITGSPVNPSHFTVLVRSIPCSQNHSYSKSVEDFFSTYYPASYVSHQMVYRAGRVDKLMKDAEKMYRMLKTIESQTKKSYMPCCLCGKSTHSFEALNNDAESVEIKTSSDELQPSQREKKDVEKIYRKLKTIETQKKMSSTPGCLCGGIMHYFKMLKKEAESVECKTSSDRSQPSQTDKERPAAFVFFRTRYAAIVAAQVLQSSNPMLWVTQLAPEPNDVYWSNLSIPYKQIWLRKIATLLGAIVFMFVFLAPVTFVQGLTQLDQLRQTFPFLKGILKQKFMNQLVTGYLPSVILMLFMYAVPPTMMLFSTIEGNVSHSERKKSAGIKVLYFTIWNVFFVNVLSGSIIRQLSVFSSFRDIPTQLAKAVPTQATFFTTYVLTSGWASLSFEVIQLFPLLCNGFRRFILRRQEEPCSNHALTFPHHTEIPRLLLFGLLGFTCSIMAPLILPFLLVYFFLAFLVYRNQILNVYVPKYESGGQFWPVVHNTTIFSLVLTQVIALGVFGIKRSPVASGFTIPLIFLTLLFNEYCRQRFSPVFKRSPAQVLIEMDKQDENWGRAEEIYKLLRTAYCQFPLLSLDLSTSQELSMAGNSGQNKDEGSSKDQESHNPDLNEIKLLS
ncbi:Membrane protein [Gossypium arboreum]|uniref:Membrane protein n=2 Tax=Gossypium arboreum TaxID=29729 RepID=A0A0B0PTJ1_GOSAR|nr:CSC1-like protein At1g10090 isoform X1 [Gossypium arboreum]XP_052885161.1 CSC1-like protein At1g10090 isoform X1 [Gossypium arboreum]XP_052885162.1 CSC1-like protein At1g10090 isoform X1 [Gossypium arboreum]KHG29773.1 Membrane protein [Gossypium arboreum]